MRNIYTVLLGVILGWQANAQNLVNNGEFNVNIDAWDYNFNNASWVSDDGAPISGNGSFRFGFIISNNAFRWAASEPIVVVPGYTYDFYVAGKIPDLSAANYAGVLVYWYDVSDIFIAQDYFSSEVNPFPQGSWEEMNAAFKAPDEASYATVRLTLSVGVGGSPDEAFALWDDVYVFEDTLFMTGFE